MRPLKGLCKNCLGCGSNRLEDETFERVYRCEWSSSKITAEQIKKENEDVKNKK